MSTEAAVDQARLRRARLAFTASLAAMAVIPLATTGTNLAFPQIEASFADTSRATLSWALSAYSISIAAFTLLGGQLSDRLDAKRVFGVGLFVFAAASLVAGLAPTAGWLIAGRALQGAGGALIVPASLVLATAEFTAQRRPMVIAIWTAAFPIGSALSPVIAAVVLEVSSWRWVFGLMAVIAVAVAVFVRFLPLKLNAPDDYDRRAPDYLGTVLGTSAMALLTLAIVQGPTWGWLSGRTVGALLTASGLVVAFVYRSLHHPRPLLDLSLYRIRTYSVASVSNMFISMAGTSVWLLWPLVMINQWGYSQIQVGLAITPTPAIAGTISIATARWAQRNGYRWLLIPGSVALLVANLWYLFMLDDQPNYVGTMLPGLILFGIGMGLSFAPINAAALAEIDLARYGQANAGFSTGRFIAGALGVAAVIAALGESGSDPFVGYDRAFLLLSLVCAASVVLLAVAWPKRQR